MHWKCNVKGLFYPEAGMGRELRHVAVACCVSVLLYFTSYSSNIRSSWGIRQHRRGILLTLI